MPPCPNCGTPVPQGARLCPTCGFDLPTVWPPPPGTPSPLGVPPPTDSGIQVALGVFLGILFFPVLVPLTSAVLAGVPGIRNSSASGYIAALVVVGLALSLYFGTRRRFRPLARAFGWAILGTLATALGALAVCYTIVRIL